MLLAFFFLSCDYNPAIPIGSSGSGYDLPYLQNFTKLRLTFSANMLQHSFIKQGTKDPGVAQDIWLPREIIFENEDTLYTIVWNDSTFQTKACVTYAQIDPFFGISYGCSNHSYVRGIYHSANKTVSDLKCNFEQLFAPDPNVSQEVQATLLAPEMILDGFDEDSASFTVGDNHRISAGYTYTELSYQTYIRTLQMTGFDTVGAFYPIRCELSFLK